MIKKIFLAVLFVIFGVFVCHGARLFEYRGVFNMHGDKFARISNYVLLKKGSRVRFEISLRTRVVKGEIVVTRLRLTSDNSISYENPQGIREFTVMESGIYEVVTEPLGVVGADEVRFLLSVQETEAEELGARAEGSEELASKLGKSEREMIGELSDFVGNKLVGGEAGGLGLAGLAEVVERTEEEHELEQELAAKVASYENVDILDELEDVEAGLLSEQMYLSEELTADSVASDDDYLFGNKAVSNLDEVASKVLKNSVAEEPMVELKALESMSEGATFEYEFGFSVLEHEQDIYIAWPQDVQWVERDLWVLDSQRRRILSFTQRGDLRRAFGEKGNEAGGLGLPVYLAVRGDNLYISDYTNRSLLIFNYAGEFQQALKTDRNTGLRLSYPGAICFRHDEMWVPDSGTSGILCFDLEHNFLGTFVSSDEAPIVEPIIVRASDTHLFVMQKNGVIKLLNPMGSVESSLNTGCSDVLAFELDYWGGLWLCDGEKGLVRRFDLKGNTISLLKAPMGLKESWVPTSISIRKDGKVAVADAANKMIHIFGVK
jgi:hypothetical protein